MSNNNIRTRNIIINKENRSNRNHGKSPFTPDDALMRLAEYYVRVYAGTVEKMHMTEEQKREAKSAVNREYRELLSARAGMRLVS